MKYFKKLIGDLVYLSPLNIEDASKYVEWLCDEDVAKYLSNYTNNINLLGEVEWVKNSSAKNEPNFAIVNKANDNLIGNIGLMNIDNVNRVAELGVFIGDKNFHGKGYGSDAIKLLLNYGFNYLNLNNITLRVLSFNERAIKAYKKCGFKEYGRLEESVYYNGKYYSLIYMNILKRDFNK